MPPATPNRSSIPALAARHDRYQMATVISRLPNQIETAFADTLPQLPAGPFKDAVLVGLGGSALPADVLNDAFADRLGEPIRVWRNYGIPPSVDASTLVILSSFSGGTEETLSALESLPSDARNVVVVSAGGRLSEVAHERSYPSIRIPAADEPEGFQPRSAFGYFATYFARILAATGIMQDASAVIAQLPEFLRHVDVRDAAEEMALWLGDRIPVVYTDDMHMLSVARVAKIKFNEHSKRPALFNALPELNHNEMIGFSAPLARFGVIYVHDPASHPRIRRRFETMRHVFEQDQFDHVACREWVMPGDTRAQKVFAAAMFADWCAYTVALLAGLDPTPVALVETFKDLLGSEDIP